MHPVELKNGVWWVGALDPQLRVFDIIMKADHGTTYNSYLVKGSEKTAVIDANKGPFSGEYLEKLREVTPLDKIDYIVVNHTEPDHSGALDALPAGAAGQGGVRQQQLRLLHPNILNRDVDPMVVGDGDSLDLGGKTLNFIQAPFLHWPDTIFTYFEEDTILFPCDFLGAHFCDDRIFDDLMDDYGHTFEYYYLVIFRPFKQYVLEAIEKISAWRSSWSAPATGPCSAPTPGSWWGCTRSGVPYPRPRRRREPCWSSTPAPTATPPAGGEDRRRHPRVGGQGQVMDIAGTELGMMIDPIEAADGMVVGSTTINADAVEPVWNLLPTWPP